MYYASKTHLHLALAALSVAVLVPAAASGAQHAQKKKKPAVKAKAGVKGTAQLPGTVGQVGVTYTLTPDGGLPMNLTIRHLAYVASRFKMLGKTVFPSGQEKFLVVDFTAQNPNSGKDRFIRNDSFDLTVVDPQNQNHKEDDDVENADTHQRLEIELKPGQKVNGRAYVVVPAAGEMPKMILDWNAPGKKVMRFDLHGKVDPVEEVLRDPSDPSGATSFAVVNPAKLGVAYPTGIFNVNAEKAEFTTNPLYGKEPEQKHHFLVVTLLVQNPTENDDEFNYGSVANSLTSDLVTADGDKIERLHDALLDYRDDAKEAQKNVLAGGEKRFRLVFEVPNDTPLKTLTLVEGENKRKLVYDLSGLK